MAVSMHWGPFVDVLLMRALLFVFHAWAPDFWKLPFGAKKGTMVSKFFVWTTLSAILSLLVAKGDRENHYFPAEQERFKKVQRKFRRGNCKEAVMGFQKHVAATV